MEKEVKGIVKKYRGKLIAINAVPYYICYFGHIKTNRKTRIRIQQLLKEAFEKELSEIDFYA